MDWTFSNLRSYIAAFHIGQFIEAARMNQYDIGWDIKLDLSPADFEAWEKSRALQAAFVFRCYWIAARETLFEVAACAICDVRGHIMRDAGSYAGPESAADNFECSRCRKHFHHTYY
jgi:hypothetical protein